MDIINLNDNSNKLYYIGGIVRDELLSRESFDIDITYVGNAIEYCSKFGEVIQVNPDFGTVKVKLDAKIYRCADTKQDNDYSSIPLCLYTSKIIDFASTRSESYPKKGHLPIIEKIGCSLKEDVMRRDFTINALAKSVTTGEIIDYVGGLEDLKNKKLRILYDESFIDDPTRIIRGLKFSVRFGFELEEHTKQLQEEYLANINYNMSYKRVKKEFIETFNLNSQRAFEKFINEKIYKLVTPNDVKLPKVNIEKLVEEYIFNSGKLKVRSGKLVIEGRKVGGLEGKLFNDSSLSETLQKQQTDNNLSSYPLTLQPSETGLPSCLPTLLPFIWLIYVGVLKDLSRLPLTKIEQKILDEVPKIKPKTDFEIYKMFEKLRIESILLYAILVNEHIARHYLDDLCQIKIEINGEDLKNIGIPPSSRYKEIFNKILKEKLKNPNMTKEDELKYLKNIL